ncbi:MAG: hypothetical protein O3B08_14065 [Proteobacteria bacterium]|nr:hypothetical protein [Pseudomonadota bacterium]
MRLGVFTAAAVIGVAGLAGSIQAAPQVLLVVTPTEELPLTCESGACTAEVAAICLQPDRANPERGKGYSVAAEPAGVNGAKSTRKNDTMTLIGETADGRQVVLPAGQFLRVLAERDHFAVTLSVDESVMQRNGLAALSVRITGNVLLFPDAEPQDGNPQTEADKQIAQTTLRGVAEKVLEQRGDTLDGAKMVRTAINALPRNRHTTEAERRDAQVRALQARVSDKAKAHAENAFNACGSVADGAGGAGSNAHYGYRHCLGIMHDGLIDGVNREYWDALKAGS